MVIMWKAVGIACLGAALPGSIELLLLSAASFLPAQRRSHVSIPWRVAVVVPAHNESASIASCVESLLDADRGEMAVEVYVIADNCTDDTARIAMEAGAQVLVRMDPIERGKGHALHFAFAKLQQLNFDCFIVVDADTVVTNNFLTEAAGAMRDGSDAVQVRYLVRNANEGVRTRLMSLALRGFNVVRPLGRERLGLSVGILGNGFGLSAQTLIAVPYLASSVVEDLEYHLLLVQAGRRVGFVDNTSVYGEIPVRGEGVKTQRSRWEGGRLRMIVTMAPKLARAVLRGRFSLLEPLLELLLLPLAFHVMLLTLAVSTPIPIVRDLALACLGIVFLHLMAAIAAGGSWRDLGALAFAPFYVLWKLRMIPALIRNARFNHAWVRTERGTEQPPAGRV